MPALIIPVSDRRPLLSTGIRRFYHSEWRPLYGGTGTARVHVSYQTLGSGISTPWLGFDAPHQQSTTCQFQFGACNDNPSTTWNYYIGDGVRGTSTTFRIIRAPSGHLFWKKPWFLWIPITLRTVIAKDSNLQTLLMKSFKPTLVLILWFFRGSHSVPLRPPACTRSTSTSYNNLKHVIVPFPLWPTDKDPTLPSPFHFIPSPQSRIQTGPTIIREALARTHRLTRKPYFLPYHLFAKI